MYQINKKAILKNLEHSFIVIILTIIVIIYYSFFTERGYNYTIFIALLVIQLIPALFLIIDYWSNSTKEIVRIDDIQIRIIRSGNEIEIAKKSIDKVIIYAVPSIKRDSNFRLFSFEAMHYVQIVIKDREDVYITSLSDSNLYKKIKSEPIFKGKVYFNKGGLSGNGSAINSIWLNHKFK